MKPPATMASMKTSAAAPNTSSIALSRWTPPGQRHRTAVKPRMNAKAMKPNYPPLRSVQFTRDQKKKDRQRHHLRDEIHLFSVEGLITSNTPPFEPRTRDRRMVLFNVESGSREERFQKFVNVDM